MWANILNIFLALETQHNIALTLKIKDMRIYKSY